MGFLPGTRFTPVFGILEKRMKTLIDPEGKYAKLIEPTLTGMGFDLVRVRTTSVAKGGVTLQVMAEHPNGAPVTVEDCTAISRAVAAILDVNDPFEGAYRLEVSSLGVPRPLTRIKDFKDYIGFEVKCEIDPPVNNRKRFKGELIETNDETFVIRDEEDREIELAYDQLSVATLVYSDALLAYEQKRAKLPINPNDEQQPALEATGE